MKLVFITTIILFQTIFLSAQERKLDWVLETKKADWPARDSHGEYVYKNHIWIMGGWDTPETPNFLDVWKSKDGKQWTRVLETAPWVQSDLPVTLVFNNKMWIMGGGHRAPKPIPTNDVWCSEDGVKWTQVTASAEWKPRLWFSTVVYRDRMWVIGGWSEENHNFGDVWYSTDGKNWTELKSDVIWSSRHEHSAFVFKDKLWVAAGAAEPSYKLNSEVWSLKIPRNWFKGK